MSLLFVAFPLFSVIALNLPFRTLTRRLAFWWLGVFCVLQSAAAAGFLMGWQGFSTEDFRCAVTGLGLDGAGAVVLLSTGLVAGAALLAGRALVRDKDRLFNYVNLLFVALAGLNGVALVADVFSLYVFIEIAAVASYILIATDREKPAMEAAFKYVILSVVASVMMLCAVALLLLVTGTTGFSGLASALGGSPHRALIVSASALFIFGALIKGGLMPFHGWLPDVYTAAPASVSVFLAGAVTKTLGAFVLVRLSVSVLDLGGALGQVVMFIGTLSIVAGALAALGQRDLKRMLAYSSISQVGYIVLGAGVGGPLGVIGAMLHLFNHSVFKSTLFLNAAAIESRAGKRDMSALGGLSGRMPFTALTSAISWLSASGIPPLSGFWSKLLIVVALWVSGHYVYAFVAVAASVLTLAYFLLMQRQVFQGNVREGLERVTEAGLWLLLPAGILAAITVGLGLAFPFWLNLLRL